MQKRFFYLKRVCRSPCYEAGEIWRCCRCRQGFIWFVPVWPGYCIIRTTIEAASFKLADIFINR